MPAWLNQATFVQLFVRSEEVGYWIINTLCVSSTTLRPLKRISMKIFRAIGLGLIIIILQLLVPRLFASFQDAAISSFKLVQTTMDVSQTAVAHNGFSISIPQFNH